MDQVDKSAPTHSLHLTDGITKAKDDIEPEISSTGTEAPKMRAGLVSTQPGPTPLTPHTSCRLYIGNLAPNLTEYVLLKMFQSHGIVRKIDYLWHKHGPKKGQPRGYCFLEYESPVSAARAIRVLDGRMFEGRKLVVGYSVDHEAVEFGGRLVNAPRRIGVLSMSGRGRGGHKGRWVESDEPVNQQLQLRSSSHSNKESKIATLERKLSQLSRPLPSPTLSIPKPLSSSSSQRGRGRGLGATYKPGESGRNHPYKR